MIKEFIERVMYEGYTYEELCMAAGGGGKSGGTQTAPVPDMITSNPIGNQLDAKPETLEEEDGEIDAIDRKKMGTRGLRIPLKSDKSSIITPSAATTGFQI